MAGKPCATLQGMELLGVFAVWLVLIIAEPWITAPPWAWRITAGVLGVICQLLIQPSHWWLGIGIGGAAIALALVADLVLVLSDWIKIQVLRRK